MSTTFFKSFAAGEISPRLFGRVDLAKFQTGLRTLRNFTVHRDGGVSNRPGSSYIDELPSHDYSAKTIPFVISRSRAYGLEFSQYKMRVIRNGEYVRVSNKLIVSISKAASAVVQCSTWHGFKTGQRVVFSSVSGMTQINGLVGVVTVVSSAVFSVNINSTGFTTYTSGGVVSPETPAYVEITTPYTVAQAREMTFSNTMLPNIFAIGAAAIAHPSGMPQTLICYGDESWFLSQASFVPSIGAPTSLTNTGAAGSATEWRVTAVRKDPFEESLYATTSSSATPTSGSPITLNWSAVTGATEYNVYKGKFGTFGYIGTAVNGTFFVDDGYTGAAIDLDDNPPELREPFGGATGSVNFPAAVAFFQQRIFYGNIGPINETNGLPSMYDSKWDPRPDGVFSSRIGIPNNFNLNRPTLDDDPIIFRLLGRQRNEIHHLLDIGKLAAFTSVGEWVMEGDQNGGLTPGVINPRQYSDHGCAKHLPPIVVWGGAVFVQEVGAIFRSFGFDFQVDGYRGTDLTTFSSHLVDGHEIVSWALQKVPNPIIWSVRDDGVLLGLTFVPDQQILGWHRHDMGDAWVEDVCVVPEGDEDAVYMVVRRWVDGDYVRYRERLNSRIVDDVRECVFVDGAVTYDGRNTNESHTMTLSGGTEWDDEETITLTSNLSYFDANQIGCKIHLNHTADPYGEEGDEDATIRFEILSVTSPYIVTGRPHKVVPESLRNEAVSDWGLAVSIIDGLAHLEGHEVSVLGDGFVVANPNNDAYDVVVVDNGEIDLPDTYVVIQAGKPIVADLETLNIDSAQQTQVHKQKLISELTVLHESSRGFWAGPVPPDDDSQDPIEGLLTGKDETKVRYDEGYDEPIALRTGTTKIKIESQWNSHGRAFIRQIDPLPLAILGIAPTGEF